MTRAACAGMAPKRERLTGDPEKDKDVKRVRDPFFPDRGDTKSDAQMVCFTCRVRSECREYANRIGAEYGVWAGAIKER